MSLDQTLKSYIRLVDALRDCGAGKEVSLPRIAVIGAQSSGKSSLLEAIVGLDFLPKGEGVVTRRPLELTLVRLPDPKVQPYAEFPQEPNAVFTDFQDVKRKIEDLTNKVAGTRKRIIKDPIKLVIYSPNCPDLALVDLPGITKLPLANSDQPPNIEQILTEMARTYVKDPRTIILAVTAANQDLTNCDGLKLAREVDPKGERTMCALTKVDALVDKNSDVMSILNNEQYHLRHGFVAVKNRISSSKMDLQQAYEDEKRFFEEHPKYKRILQLVGRDALATRLSNLLFVQIKDSLGLIESEIREKHECLERQLQDLGEPFPQEELEKFIYITTRGKQIAHEFKDKMEKKLDLESKEADSLSGYARFNLLINKFDSNKKKLFFKFLADETTIYDIILDIVNYKNFSVGGSLPKEMLEKRVMQQLEALKKPIREFIEGTKELNKEIFFQILSGKTNMTEGAKRLMQDIGLKYLDYLTADTESFIMKYIEFEKKMITTKDTWNFVGGNPEIKRQTQTSANSTLVMNGSAEKPNEPLTLVQILETVKKEYHHSGVDISGTKVEEFQEAIAKIHEKLGNHKRYEERLNQIKKNNIVISDLVSVWEVLTFLGDFTKYFNIVNRNLTDTVTKIIGANLMKNFFEDLEKHFTDVFKKEKKLLEGLREDDDIRQRRADCEISRKRLRKALDILSEFNSEYGSYY